MKPLVSVIMPVYNSQQNLSPAINSILNQSFSNFEFIIINDGSTDNTRRILNNWSSKDQRIRLLENKSNQGVAKSLNLGLRQARGKYIARQDADDISRPKRLKEQINFLRVNRSIGLLGTFAIEIDRTGSVKRHLTFPTHPSHVKALSLTKTCFVHGSVMYRKSLVIKLGGYPQRRTGKQVEVEDFELWARLTRYYPATNLPKFLYHLRSTKSLGRSNLATHARVHNRIERRLNQEFSAPKNPKVTVIIPTYNRPTLISQAIASVLNQTEKDLELIVVNDGSRSPTHSILDRLAKKDSRLFPLYIPHLGHAAARNSALRWSRGSFIAFLDDDDSWLPTKLAKQLRLFKTSPYKKTLGLVYCYHYWINSTGRKIGQLKISNRGHLFPKLTKGNTICGSGSAVLTKKQCLDEVGPFNENLSAGVDWEMWLRIAYRYNVDFVPEFLLNVRNSKYSVTKDTKNLLKNHFKIYIIISKLVLRNPQYRSITLLTQTIWYRAKADVDLFTSATGLSPVTIYHRLLGKCFNALPTRTQLILKRWKHSGNN